MATKLRGSNPGCDVRNQSLLKSYSLRATSIWFLVCITLDVLHFVVALGFLHSRTNLSPFTKDFRGGDQLDEYLTIFLRSGFGQTDHDQ